jgi:hypothetical protein
LSLNDVFGRKPVDVGKIRTKISSIGYPAGNSAGYMKNKIFLCAIMPVKA